MEELLDGSVLETYPHRLELLYGISRAVLESSSLEHIVGVALDRLQALIPTWRTSVVLFRGDEAEVYATTGGNEEMPAAGTRFPLAEFRANLPKLRRGEIELQQTLDERALASQMLVPLIWKHQVVGSLNFGSRTPHFFTPLHVEIAKEVADQLTVAILQAELQLSSEAATHAKSAFLANVSHELRTPLNAIVGYTELVLEDPELSDPVRQDLGRVAEAARGLVGLVSDVLDLSRIDSGVENVERAPLRLLELLETIEGMMIPLAHAGENTLEVRSPPDLMVTTDPQKLHQILVNLLSNACKFTRRGQITVTASTEGSAVLIAVRDTGSGIDPVLVPVIFDAFTQAHTAPVGTYQGTGLGLALSKQFCEALGGTITVESTLGEGSTFTVRLPA